MKINKSWNQKTKFGPKNKWLKISYLEFFFWKYYFRHTAFLYSSTCSSGHQKLAKKTPILQYSFARITLFYEPRLFGIKNNILPQRSQKPFLLYKFSSKHVPNWCQKKHLHCIISWCSRSAFLKHFQRKCLYISVYRCK